MWRAVLLTVAVAVLAGCGAARDGGPFAGLPKYDAGTEAAKALTDAEADSTTPIAGRTLAVAGMEQGRKADGGQAWIVHLETLTGKPVSTCLFIWGHEGFQSINATYDVGACPTATS